MNNPPWRVLVVDDLLSWSENIKLLAERYECEVRPAIDFVTAVREVALWRPHLIILDFHMPPDAWRPIPELRQKYDPYQKSLAFCEQITSHPRLENILIVMTSVEDQQELQDAAIAAGAYKFVVKTDFTEPVFASLLGQVRQRI